jgi:putative ABC transport system permease protein
MNNVEKSGPPGVFLRFFRWYCHPKLAERIEGDLIEDYDDRIQRAGKRSADIRFVTDVILLFRPGIIRPPEGSKNLNAYGMYKSYFKIGWRSLLRNKGYSILNVAGLAIGMTVAMLNGLWIWDEFSYNKNFPKYDRIAQVAEIGLDMERGGTWLGTTMTYPLGTTLKEEYGSKFVNIARTSFIADKILIVDDTKISFRGLYVDGNFPELLSLKMIRGSQNGLKGMSDIFLSESTAKILFGEKDPMGRVIRLNNQADVIVTGIYEDGPQNSHFADIRFFIHWDLFLPENKWIEEGALTDWRNHFLKIYVEIPEGESFEGVNAEVGAALRFDPQDLADAMKREQKLYLYPMSEWHLHPPGLRDGQFEPIKMIKLVGAIGAFVLILACINFTNLSTARAEKRAKEVGIRKTIGSMRGQLVTQFFSESFLVIFFSFIFAVGLTATCLPAFNEVAGKNMIMPWTSGLFWSAGLCFVMITSMLAGSYPALYLSSFSPIKALKGTFRAGRSASIPRQVLVVFQFCISSVLIIGTIVVHQQIQFAKDRPVGYNREGLIMIPKKSNDFNGKYEVLRSELKNTGAVFEVSESMGPMTEIASGNNGWEWNGKDPNIDGNFATLAVSHLHGKTVGWQFIQGRDFNPDNPGDSAGLVITESALKIMNLENPIGEPVTWTWWVDKRILNYKILGVINDLVMDSPYDKIQPSVFYLRGFNGSTSWINVRIDPQTTVSDALPNIESVFRKVIPNAPFDYQFADDAYALKFGEEERIANLAAIFAVLAIFISCLGLLGLISFVTETRTKEIGIRKVLGASVAGLWQMLSTDFLRLVLISTVVAVPFAYYLMSQWLEKFVYRVNISVWVFVVTGSAAITITLLTISYQSVKAARMNPVNSLRSE